MALTLTVTARCDMCGREESRDVREAWRSGRYETDAPSCVSQFPHWSMLDREGIPVRDFRNADGRVLCEGCANVYRDTIRRQQAEMDALFGK